MIAWIAAVSAAADPAQTLHRGQHLYELGVGSGRATLASEVDVAAAVVPCAGCHGLTGAPPAEGGLAPPSLRWAALTRPYPVVTGGRTHDAYDADSVVRAVRDGLDPAGNRLDASMPRYTFDDADTSALVAWLERGLGNAPVPGVTEDGVRLGCFVTADADGARIERALRARLAGTPPINGRTVELACTQAPLAPARFAALVSLGAEVLAVVAPDIRGLESEARAAAEQAALPMIGPVEGPRSSRDGRTPGVYDLVPTVDDRAAALLAVAREAGGPIALIGPIPSGLSAVPDAGAAPPTRGGVVFFGDMDAVESLRARLDPRVTLYALGEAEDRRWEGATHLNGPLVLAWPVARGPDLRAGHGHSRAVTESDAAARAVDALDLTLAALARAGRDLDRPRLRAALEGELGASRAPGAHGTRPTRVFVVTHIPGAGTTEGRWFETDINKQ